MTLNGLAQQRPLSRRELLAALLIFLLPFGGLFGNVGVRPQWLEIALVALLGGTLLFALGYVVKKRLPRWSLPYLGIVLMPAVLLTTYPVLWGWMGPRFLSSYGSRGLWSLGTRILYSGVTDYMALFLTFLAALLLTNLLRLLPYTRGVWRDVRADWTALSFLLYGGLVFLVALLFEEYRYDEIWSFLAWLCLALGAWLYLRAKEPRRRILALLAGATSALWIVALAKWVLIPRQVHWLRIPGEMTRWHETGVVLVSWLGIVLLLLAPAVLSLMPPPGHTIPEQKEPVAV